MYDGLFFVVEYFFKGRQFFNPNFLDRLLSESFIKEGTWLHSFCLGNPTEDPVHLELFRPFASEVIGLEYEILIIDFQDSVACLV